MTPDVYGAWLTAGNNLQPLGVWLAANWPNLAIAAVLAVFAAWSIRRAIRQPDQRARNDQRAARLAALEPRPEPGAHGTDNDLLNACNTAYYGPTHQTRREKP